MTGPSVRTTLLALVWVLGTMACAATAVAQDVKIGDSLVIEAPWTRATPPGAKVGAGYMSVINIGKVADRLIAASSPIAERVEIHTMTMQNGIMRMRRLENGIELKPQQVAEMKPGGNHLMFIGLKRAISKGEKISLEVVFAKAGKISLTLLAAGIGASRSPFGQDAAAGGSNSGSASGSHSGSASGSHSGSGSGAMAPKPKGSN